MVVFLSTRWQPASTWNPDLLSIGIGLLAGVLLMLLLQRLAPLLARWVRQQRGRAQQRFAEARAGLDQQLQQETAAYVQQLHLGRRWADLSQVFVSPRFLAPPTDFDPQQLPDWGAAQLNIIWPELAAGVATPHAPELTLRQLLRTARRVVVSAEPGAGKTTLLAYAAYVCTQATHDSEDAFLAPMLPVLLHVADLDLSREGEQPLNPLRDWLVAQGEDLARREVGALIQRRARSGNLLLLLDGWDELPVRERTAVLGWLQRLLERYADVRVIVSAGLTGYGVLTSLSFTWTVLRSWRLTEAEKFAAAWARVLSNNPLPHNRFWLPGRSALQTSQRFWLVAFGKEAAAAYRPSRQIDLLTACLAAFFAQDVPGEGRGQVLVFWQNLAYAMLSQAKLRLTRAELVDVAQRQLPRGGADQLQALLNSTQQSPFFVVDRAGNARFLSAVWRDFFAAQFLVEQQLLAEVEARVRDPLWAGVLRFVVSRTAAERLAAHLLKAQVTSPSRNGLFQVASWMPEVQEDGEWRRQTMILLGQLTRQRTFAQVLRQRAAAALVQTGESGRWAFVQQLLERSDPFLRRAGVVALSHLGLSDPAQAIELLTQLQADGDGQVRQMSVYALAWLSTPLAEKPLLAALIDGDAGMRRAAAEGFTLLGKEGAEILREALEDESLDVRLAAVRALSLIDEPWVLKTLAQVEHEDAEWSVRSAASGLITELEARVRAKPWTPLQPRSLRWLVEYATREGRVVPEGKAALPFLVQVMTHAADGAVRAAAALALGQLPDPQSQPALETAVRDSDPLVQEAAFATFCLVSRAFDE